MINKLKVTLDLWKPNPVIADLAKLFDLFAPVMKQLGLNYSV